MNREKIVVIGGGGHAKVIISILKKLNKYDVKGYTALENNGDILGVPFLGRDDVLLELFNKDIRNAVIGLGQIKSSFKRRYLIKILKDIGFNTPYVISPSVILNNEVIIGKGTVIMDGVVINSGTKIGEYSIINTHCSIDHDCRIGDYSHLAPGVVLSGDVVIGNDVLLGTGSSVIQKISITDGTLISAGSTVLKSIYQKGIYRGNPAQLLRSIE